MRARGCADGDLPLGRYASLRNEAFVPRRIRTLVHREERGNVVLLVREGFHQDLETCLKKV